MSISIPVNLYQLAHFILDSSEQGTQLTTDQIQWFEQLQRPPPPSDTIAGLLQLWQNLAPAPFTYRPIWTDDTLSIDRHGFVFVRSAPLLAQATSLMQWHQTLTTYCMTRRKPHGRHTLTQRNHRSN